MVDPQHAADVDKSVAPRPVDGLEFDPDLRRVRGIAGDELQFVERSAQKARAAAVARAMVGLVVLALAGGWAWSVFFRPGRLKLASKPPGARGPAMAA